MRFFDTDTWRRGGVHGGASIVTTRLVAQLSLTQAWKRERATGGRSIEEGMGKNASFASLYAWDSSGRRWDRL